MANRILITDDSLFTRIVLKDLLIQHGYEICGEAANGKEAIDLYHEKKPDIVTLDITMPVMDGITALKQIKAIDPEAKVIMCTAMGQKNLVTEAISAGANDFIVKPFQAEKVLHAIEKLLEAS
jgi:two-component system chemotaxis response regulator CheY